MLCFDYKKTYQRWKHIALMDFAEYILENQTFQRIAKFIMADFFEMDFMKGIFILVKVDEMYNILDSASHYLLVQR